jgi:hypothetical protein
MPEDVRFESESTHSREETAVSLRRVAENLEAAEPVTLKSGD